MSLHNNRSDEFAPQLTARHMGRYQRQMVLPQVGIEGQRRLMRSHVLVVGAGALGSAAATYLAAAGVGTIGLVDGDRVDLSNLHRQILHTDRNVGELKTTSGKERLKIINPDLVVREHRTFLSADNVLEIFSEYDCIVNGSDNFPTRYLVNDAAVFGNKPLVDAAILRFEGQLAVFRPGHGCYRCLFPTPPPAGTVPDCATAGIFGAVAGVLGSLEAVETLKLLLDLGTADDSSFLLYEALSSSWHRIPFRRNPHCVVCGEHPSVTRLIDYESFCGEAGPGSGAAAVINGTAIFSVNPRDAVGMMHNPEVAVLDVRDPQEFAVGRVPGSQPCALENLDDWADARSPQSPILVVCAAGVRSAYAAQYLRSRGFDAWTLVGGVAAWTAAELPWDATPVAT